MTSVKYPRVVTLSQINQMISQRLVDVDLEGETDLQDHLISNPGELREDSDNEDVPSAPLRFVHRKVEEVEESPSDHVDVPAPTFKDSFRSFLLSLQKALTYVVSHLRTCAMPLPCSVPQRADDSGGGGHSPLLLRHSGLHNLPLLV